MAKQRLSFNAPPQPPAPPHHISSEMNAEETTTSTMVTSTGLARQAEHTWPPGFMQKKTKLVFACGIAGLYWTWVPVLVSPLVLTLGHLVYRTFGVQYTGGHRTFGHRYTGPVQTGHCTGPDPPPPCAPPVAVSGEGLTGTPDLRVRWAASLRPVTVPGPVRVAPQIRWSSA